MKIMRLGLFVLAAALGMFGCGGEPEGGLPDEFAPLPPSDAVHTESASPVETDADR